jgi:hypothetical protein
VPFLCPWPVPDCGGHQICCQANFTVLVLICFQNGDNILSSVLQYEKPAEILAMEELLRQQMKKMKTTLQDGDVECNPS